MDGEDVHPQTQVAPWNQTFSSQSQQASTSSMSLSDMIPKEDHDDDENDEQHSSSLNLNGHQVSRGFTISQGDNDSSISPQPSQSEHMQSPAGSSTFDYGSCHEISQQQLVSQTFDSDVHQGGVDPSYDDDDDDDDDDDNTQQHHTTSPTRASNVASIVPQQQQDGDVEESSNGSGSVNGLSLIHI